jgi:ubiquinone/menaquinone biosynthesis C-methylase UbiE
MGASVIDPQKFKSMQRQNWDSVAQGWKKWWKVIEENSQVVSDRLVENGGIHQGSRVLDVATGIGEPAVTAAKIVGPSGKVTAIDLSPGMLSIARERAKEMDLSNIIEFQEGDAESLHLPPSSFDAVLCRFGLMFMPDVTTALKVMRDTLVRNGGRIAAAVWSSADKVPSFRLPLEIVMEETGTPPPPTGLPGPLALSDTNLLRQRFEGAGFENIKIEKDKMNFKFSSSTEFAEFVQNTGGSLGAMMAGLSAARQQEIWNKVVDATSKHAGTQTGNVNFTNEVIYVFANR